MIPNDAGTISHSLVEVGSVSTAVGPKNVPQTIRSLGSFSAPDYIDLFTVRTARPTRASAEQWARAILEEAPLSRRNARVLWRLMGLRLGPRGLPQHVQGWKIAVRGDNWLLAETGSWYLTAQAVCIVEQDYVSISLSLRYDRPVATVVWRLVEGQHQKAVPVMLRQAVRVMEAKQCARPSNVLETQ